MTTDEIVTEIRALYEAMHHNPDVVVDTRLDCGPKGTSARHGSYGAFATSAAEALDVLRGKIRDAAVKALADHEAKVATLRKALGITVAHAEAHDSLTNAVLRYFKAERVLYDAEARGVRAEVHEADQELRRMREGMLIALNEHAPSAVKRGAL